VRGQHPEMAVVLITHYQRVLSLLSPTHIHVLLEGRVVASGGLELAQGIEQGGYQSFRSQEVVQ
jgi:Fe-S cluster assembly ATP-binding protein